MHLKLKGGKPVAFRYSSRMLKEEMAFNLAPIAVEILFMRYE
jgi:hypothetical protein